ESTINVGPVEVGFVLEDVLPVINQHAEQKNIEIQVDADKELTFEADEEKIKQILLNLLTNAISYTPEKGTVSLNVKDNEDSVCLQVKDTGIGISKEALPRIFERFYRVDKDRSRDTGGTGLGLAIVKHIVEVHQGEITVESELGKGTTFSVLVPKEQVK